MSIDFDRIQSVVSNVMESIAMCNIDRYLAGDTDAVEHAIDNAFMALSYALPEVSSIDDTVTRRCAKTEIHSVFEEIAKFVSAYPNTSYRHLFDNLDVEAVMDDIRAMNDEDDD